MREFKKIIEIVHSSFTNKQDLESLMPTIISRDELRCKPDSTYLSLMTRRIFQAGMKHSVVNDRWSHFDKVFWQFEPAKCALISDEQLESFMQDKGLIRHWAKMKTIPVNAAAMLDCRQEFGGFGGFLADWPEDDLPGLWRYIARKFARMGGNSAPYFLRTVGKDTFILTDDVVTALIREEVVDKKPTSETGLKKVQEAFSQWQRESGYPYAHISKLLALSVG